MTNKDTVLKNKFIFKLPSKSLSVLTKSNGALKKWGRKKTKDKKRLSQIINWEYNLLSSLSNSVQDNAAAIALNELINDGQTEENNLFIIHLTKAKCKKITGFYGHNCTFIGVNDSRTIAHESLHHLGAYDLYIHKYWPGKRRHIVKQGLAGEIMNSAPIKTSTCYNSYLSNYTSYCMGWNNTLNRKYKPLLKLNLMALKVFKKSPQ